MTSWVSGCIAFALAVHCGPVLAQSAPPPPPFTGAYQPHGVDEVGIWREDDESERKLSSSNLVIRDEKLNAYVRSVFCETVGNDRCSAVRIYIIREPTFNASMSPNGTMRIFSGLFLRVRSEAELASVLGHEFGHFERRHGVEGFKAGRRSTDLLAWAAVLASLAPSYQSRRSYENLELSVYGSIFRYKRNQERDADFLGIAYLNASKFRPQAASKVWQNIMAEADASAQVRGLKKPDFNAIAFTASHPPDGERAAYLAKLAEPTGEVRDEGAERYNAALATWMPVFLDDQIKLNDFGASEYIIQSLGQGGWAPWLWYARGELYRGRGNQRDLVNAIEYYSNAISQNRGLAEAYRGLGLSLVKTGRLSEGQAALRTYLKLMPEALDARLISLMLPKESVER